jgi:hypothetical protein
VLSTKYQPVMNRSPTVGYLTLLLSAVLLLVAAAPAQKQPLPGAAGGRPPGQQPSATPSPTSQGASQAGPSEFEWRFSIKQNQTASSNIQARNICRRPHRFEVETEGLPAFMSLQGTPGFLVQPQSQYLLPVQFNSAGLSIGLHEGRVVIHCLTCREEKTCSQDYQRLHIYMTVEGLSAAATPSPQPGSGRANPTVPPAAGGISTATVPVSSSSASGGTSQARFVPSRVLVLVAAGGTQSAEATAQGLAKTYGMEIVELRPLESIHAVLVAYKLRPGADVRNVVGALLPHVLLAQPDFVYEAFGGRKANSAPSSNLQYGPLLIRADRLRGSVTGKGVKIALVDTGLDAAHPALKDKISEQVDMTGKGFTPDVHATLLAGIIASTPPPETENLKANEPAQGTGVFGIAPSAKILAIKACQPASARSIKAECWSFSLAQALDFAIQHNAAIINLSLGGPAGPEEKLLKQILDVATSRGIVVVAAAGNNGPRGQPGFPAALPSVIAVTAVDAKEQLYPYATQGDFVDLAAPGVEIVSTSPGSKFLVSSGTSLAAAFVTGAAALVLQEKPHLSPQAVQTLLERTAKDLGPPGKDRQFGSGLVDTCHAVTELNHNHKLCR